MPVFHFTQISICYKLNTSISLFFLEKYYKAHIGTKLAYKPNVTPRCCGDSQAL